MTGAESDPIILFYAGQAADVFGRGIEEIWAWDHEQLEVVHDYIQWLFPLRERSRFNPQAPSLTDGVVEKFLADAVLRGRLKKSLEVMLGFYGFEMLKSDGPVQIKCAPSFRLRSPVWLHPMNHNHLRLTRILSSIRTLGLEKESAALFSCLAEIYRVRPDKITADTFQYWQRAAEGTA